VAFDEQCAKKDGLKTDNVGQEGFLKMLELQVSIVRCGLRRSFSNKIKAKQAQLHADWFPGYRTRVSKAESIAIVERLLK
jgi:hypothetical protein